MKLSVAKDDEIVAKESHDPFDTGFRELDVHIGDLSESLRVYEWRHDTRDGEWREAEVPLHSALAADTKLDTHRDTGDDERIFLRPLHRLRHRMRHLEKVDRVAIERLPRVA